MQKKTKKKTDNAILKITSYKALKKAALSQFMACITEVHLALKGL